MRSEVYNIEPSNIYCGDCIELMPHIADKSVDCILCDLPFGTTKNKWDTIIPFEPLWEQYNRIIKDDGAIVLFSQQPFTSMLVMSNPKMFKYEWIWEKDSGTGHLNSKFAPMKIHENICVFSKSAASFVKDRSKAMMYNPQYRKGKPYKGKGGLLGNGNYDSKWERVVDTFNDGEHYSRLTLLSLIEIKKICILLQNLLSCVSTLSVHTPTKMTLYLTTAWEAVAQSLLQSERNDSTLVSKRTRNSSR